ncbi:MAG: RNA polymerase sporulation sigma factor SigE [Clostridia bacterium]|nr:RNA polymerase sporulation sigma factor SigE [Clostridia bacterium]MBR2892684.1 RNA polymerase sporulation sigma factor SigE [Clostridia bacterium]
MMRLNGLILLIKNKINAFFNEDAVYYVNGAQNLPPPLTKDEENRILCEIDEDNFEHRELLVIHNLRLVVYIARKFENTGVGIEDLVSIGTIGLIKAVNTFRPSKKIKLATYASRCIENEILMYLRKTAKNKNELSFDEPLNVDWDGNELLLSDVLGSDSDSVNRNIEYQDEKKQLLRCVENLSDREKQIMTMRFGLFGSKEYTQKQVADMLGISQSYISRLEKRIVEKLKREIEKA